MSIRSPNNNNDCCHSFLGAQLKRSNRLIVELLSIFTVIAVSGCGGGGGGGGGDGVPPTSSTQPPPSPPADTTSPTVSSVTPLNMQRDAELDIVITVTFDEPINGESLSSSNFSVTNKGESLAGSLDFDPQNNTATFTPDSPLKHFTDYEISVGPDIEDSAGNPMNAAEAWEFTTRDWHWGTPFPLENNGGALSKPHIAISKSDDALVSWSEQIDGVSDDLSARYTTDTGWEAPKQIGASTTYSWSPRVAYLDDNTAFALSLLRQEAATVQHHLLLKKMDANGNWGAGQLVERNVSLYQMIAASGDGAGIVAWAKHDGANTSLYATPLTDAGALPGSQLLETSDLGFPGKPRLAVDPYGNAFAVWAQWSGSRNRIYANRFDSASGNWSTSGQPIDAGINTDVFSSPDPRISLDSTGNAIAVWQDDNGTVSRISAANYLVTGGWQAPQTITQVPSGNVEVPVVRMVSSNTAIAIWMGPTRSNGYLLRYSKFENGSWSAPQILTDEGHSNWNAEIVSRGDGKAYIFWHHVDEEDTGVSSAANRTQIFGMKYSETEGFSSPDRITTGLGDQHNYMSSGEYDNPFAPAILNSDGIPIITWRGYSPASTIYINTLK